MKVETTYPPFPRQKLHRIRLIRFLKWPFLFAAYICPLMNLFTGGKAWSVIVLWSLWMLWSIGIAPSLVEYNLISQFIKLITQSSILLILIDVFLSPGFAIEVVPIVCFGGLTIAGVFFFTNIERQQQNMMPMLMLCGVSLLCSIIGLIIWGRQENAWALLVMGAFASALIVACFIKLGASFIRNMKKYFAAK